MSEAHGIVPLLKYQRDFLEDPARGRIVLKSRQTGFTKFVFSLGPVLDAISDAPQKSDHILLSAGERQSREMIEAVRRHCQAVQVVADYHEDDFRTEDGATAKQAEVRLRVRDKLVRIIGLPANPFTARGYTGHVTLDEFAFHRDSHAIWRALAPSITWGYRLTVGSTPMGLGNKFAELWQTESDFWSKHFVDIYTAVRDGLPANVDELRALLGDPEGWAQEYECQFLDEGATLLTHALISACEDPALRLAESPAELEGEADLYLGMDIGRKRDLSVLWVWQKQGDTYRTRAIFRLAKTRFAEQREWLYALLGLNGVRRCCIDATGIGAQLAEEAEERWGARVESVAFTAPVKEDLAVTTLRVYQDGAARIPVDQDLRRALNSVKKVVTSAGNVRYDADRSERFGHADEFWAGALGLHAANDNAAGPVVVLGASRRAAYALLARYGQPWSGREVAA